MGETTRTPAAWFLDRSLLVRNQLKIQALQRTISAWRESNPEAYRVLRESKKINWEHTELPVVGDEQQKAFGIPDPISDELGSDAVNTRVAMQKFVRDYRRELVSLLRDRMPDDS